MEILDSIMAVFFGYLAIPVGIVMIFLPFFWHPEGATVTYVIGSWLAGSILIIMCLYLHISVYFDDRIIRENEEYYQKMKSGMERK